MGKDKELITRIILKGQTDPTLQKAFNQANKATDGAIAKLQSYGQFAKKAATLAATAIGTGMAASVKSAIDYESAFAGVMKTVNETGTTTYDDLSKGIIEMSKRMPASANEIAGVAEAAGQLGIKADDVLKFSETMVNLGTTTNLTSEEAASSIAKMFNIMGTNMKDVDRFGATIVALGNNAATTESDIVNMASRIAAGGTQIGLTESEILALSTTLSSVGLEAEAGGTAISTVMANIDKTVATNGDELKVWAKTAGMSSKEFKAAWSSDAYGTLQKVIGGMGDASKGGTNLNVLLEDLGVSGIRTTDTMKRLTNASKLMGDMTQLANTAWSENTALTNEASVRYGTTASKIEMMKNKLVAFGIQIGEKLMPVVDKMIDTFNKIDFDKLADKIGNAFDWIVEHKQEILTAISAIAGAFVAFKIGSFIGTIVKAAIWVGKLVKMFGLFKVVAGLFGGPLMLAVTVIGALAGAFIYLWNTSDGFRQFWINLWEQIKHYASVAGEWLKNLFTVTIPNAFNTAIQWCVNLGNKMATGFSNMYHSASTWVVNTYNTVVSWFASLPGRIWAFLTDICSKVVSWGSDLAAKGQQAATDLFNAVVNKIKEIPGEMLSIGKNIVSSLWNGISNSKFVGKIKSFGSGILSGITSLGGSGTGSSIPKHGTGGTFTTPHTAIIGDKPETIVPHGNTPHNRALLQEAARGVGAKSGGGNIIQITFAPVLNGGNVEENRRMLQEEEAEFERKMDAYFAKKGRLAFQ